MSPINIYQIYYQPGQKVKLDPGFIPYNNEPFKDPTWCEYGVMKRLYESGAIKDGITGFVSWKYRDITNHSGQSVLSFIRKNPADCYILYPFEYKGTKNIWRQGDESHPSMLRLVQTIFKELGHSFDIASLEQPCTEFLLRNYFAATREFWDLYMRFTIPICHYLQDRLTAPQKKIVYNDQSSVASSATMHPYIMERLFSTFIAILPQWKIARIPNGKTSKAEYKAFKDIVMQRF